MTVNSQPYETLASRIDRLRRSIHRIDLMDGILRALLFSLLTVAAAIMFELALVSSVAGRWTLLSLCCTALLAILGVYAGIPALRALGIMRSYNDDRVAAIIGKHFPEISDRLANAMQIGRMENHGHYSENLVEAAIRDVETASLSLDFNLAANRSRILKITKQTGIVLLILITGAAVWREPVTRAFARIIDPANSMSPGSLEWTVSPGNASVLQGDDALVEIRLRNHGIPVSSGVRLFFKPSVVETFKSEMMSVDSAYAFRMKLQNVRQDMTYFASWIDEGEELKSPLFDLTVIHRPAVKRFTTEIFPPSYTGDKPRLNEDNIGDISAPVGSRVEISVEGTKSLASAAIVFDDGSQTPMSIGQFNAVRASAGFQILRNGSYHFSLTDRDSAGNLQPVEYRIVAIPDEYPVARITDPKNDIDVTEQMLLPISLDAQDDYGFTRLLLHYRRDKTSSLIAPKDSVHAIDLSFLLDAKQTSQTITYIWNYATLGLQPEDLVTFYFEVFDNDPIRGPKSSLSDRRSLRFPSLEEILKEINQKQDESIAKAEDVVKESESLKQDLEEINKELLKDKKLDWKDQEKLKKMADRQEKLRKEVEELQKSVDELSKKMQDNQVLSPETMAKYNELQQLMAEINNSEMQDAMRKLQQAMENNFNAQQLKEALKDFKFNQETFRQNIERTLELMKRIKAEQLFDQLVKQTENLALRQQTLDSLSHGIRNDNERQALMKEQDDVRQGLEQLKKRGEELSDLLKQLDKNIDREQLEKTLDEIRSGQLQDQMLQNRSSIAQNLQSGKENRQNQKETEQQLDSLKNQMQSARDQFQKRSDQQVLSEMRKILFDMVQISKDQEVVMGNTAGLNSFHPRLYQVAQAQADVLSNMSTVTENIIELGNHTFFVSTALGKTVAHSLNSMDGALRDLEERNSYLASQKQLSAMTAVNDAVKMMMQSVDRMNQGESGTGLQQLMEQLQTMAGQQGSINDQSLPFAGSGSGRNNQGMLTPEQQAAMGRLLAEQQALKQSMENAQQQAEGHQDLQKRMGNIADEMEDVIRDMKEQKIDRQTIERQQKILQRMLDASHSVREKEFSEKRQSETGKEYLTKNPGELPKDVTERKNRLRRDLLKELRRGYSKDYEDLIRRYFEALGEHTQE